jgi:hypothetical protein
VGDPGGGDDTGGAVPLSDADQPVKTYATSDRDGSWARFDLIPVAQGSPATGPSVSASQQTLLDNLMRTGSGGGTDLNKNWTGTSASLPTAGFDAYETGLPPGSFAGYIIGANNLYDLFQTTTGRPKTPLTINMTAVNFPGYNGGDIDSLLAGGNAAGDGGPGLFSNVPSTDLLPGQAVPPKHPTIPNTMGGTAGTSGRGAQADDQHQFVQAQFAYPLDRDSLFNPSLFSNSFLGDTLLPGNVNIVKHSIQHPPGDEVNIVDQVPAHVSGVAVIGGVTAIPTGFNPALGLPANAVLDLDPASPTFSNVPIGALGLIGDANTFTYIAHESPDQIPVAPFSAPPVTGLGYIVDAAGIDTLGTGAGTLVLATPTAGLGGRVFGAEAPHVGSVNDAATSGDEAAAAVGFFSIEFERLRSAGKTISAPYFHSFPLHQGDAAGDTRAVNGSFNRGPAITVSSTNLLPSIDILDSTVDAIGFYDPQPTSDQINVISTGARFRVDFDREVVPNSVGFSRRHTIHSTAALGTVFSFNGNTRPVFSPAGQLVAGATASPLAPSIYLAVNQEAGINFSTGLLQPANALFQVAGAPALNPDGSYFQDDGVTKIFDLTQNGLTPKPHNSLATLPRGVIPCDIYPLNQNNLQSYVVEPLVEIPPGTVVTLGVCMPGLRSTFYGLSNQGNFTRSGTLHTPFQALDLTTGLAVDPSLKTAMLANNTVVKVNAGPMSLDGMLFFGGTNVALHRKVNADPNPGGSDDLTSGGYNVSRTFQVGTDNTRTYVNAPVSPQALYLAFITGGAGVLDLNGYGYNTNAPLGSLENTNFKNLLTVSRFLPRFTHTVSGTAFNWVQGGSAIANDHRSAFGIIGRYSSGAGQLSGNIESDHAVGAPIPLGPLTKQPGVNEGSSGYETLVKSSVKGGDPATASAILAPTSKVGIVRDIEVGDFLDTIYFDTENPFTIGGHHTYNTPLQGTLDSNTIADPPTPNPPPLRFPVGLPHQSVKFDQFDLTKPPVLIEGTEVYTGDVFFQFELGGVASAPRTANGLIQLDPTQNLGNQTGADRAVPPNPGFNNTFAGPTSVATPKFIQTGPAPKSSTAAASILATLNNAALGSANPSGLIFPFFESRQQIGNFLFVADGVNKKVHALNSNTMEIIKSLKLPDPYGLGLTADLRKLFVSNEGDNTVSIVDADPTSPAFMTEIKRVKVGLGPRAVAANSDGEDVLVCNYSGNTISILSQTTGNVRKTLTSNGISRPYDIAVGMREATGGPAFQSGTYHAYISNFGGNNVLIFESGPDGIAGIGYDNVVGSISSDEPSSDGQEWQGMVQPRGITFDPIAPLDGFSLTVGCFVAHRDDSGRAIASRISYWKDSSPGTSFFNTLTGNPNLGGKIFEVRAQYLSSFSGVAYDVALPDYHRKRFLTEDFGSFYNLFNAGATPKSLPILERNSKYPLADNIVPAFLNGPRWEPDRVYLSVGGNVIEVFDINGVHQKTITTPAQVGVMASYFSQ